MSCYLLHCNLDLQAVMMWAIRERLMVPDGDIGYALHVLLVQAFGDQAPTPFRYMNSRQGLLAYSDYDAATLQTRLNAQSKAVFVQSLLDSQTIACKALPTVWQVGQRLAFEVRFFPVVRRRRSRKDFSEQDVFLQQLEQASSKQTVQREAVYRDWLAQQFAAFGAAELLTTQMTAFRLTTLLHSVHHQARGLHQSIGPDVIVHGQLQIINSDRFVAFVRRGIGRQRAFGFGMLLLRPLA
jgi:CRISPR system Cascade subunit CasE